MAEFQHTCRCCHAGRPCDCCPVPEHLAAAKATALFEGLPLPPATQVELATLRAHIATLTADLEAAREALTVTGGAEFIAATELERTRAELAASQAEVGRLRVALERIAARAWCECPAAPCSDSCPNEIARAALAAPGAQPAGDAPSACATCRVRAEAEEGTRLCRSCLEIAATILMGLRAEEEAAPGAQKEGSGG